MEVVSTGMVCSVGLTAAAGCAAMRAGIAQFGELRYHDDSGELIVGATVPGLDSNPQRGHRLVEMLNMALKDLLEGSTSLHTETVPLLIGMAEPGRPGGGARLAGSILGEVEKKLDVRFHPRLSRVFAKRSQSGVRCDWAALGENIWLG